jgi:hypothetical protein
VYKVIPDAIELSKTLDPWAGYQYNTLCCPWVGKTFVIFVFYLFNSLCSLYTCNIIFNYTMLIYYWRF